MSLYYNNFRYLDKNSIDQGLMVTSFEPDDGFTDSFLSMDLIQEDYYDGTKKFDYGAKYNSTYVVNITVIKNDGSDFSLLDVRKLSKWLTGSRTNSWLDVGPVKFVPGKDDDENIKYSFLGRVTNLQPRKLDGRTVGFLIEFSSISPWAFSIPKTFPCQIGQLIDITSSGIMIKKEERSDKFAIDTNGVVSVGGESGKIFSISSTGLAYIDSTYSKDIDNDSDDLYTYIYLDIDYTNDNGTYLTINNATLNEQTIIKNIKNGESISISSKQFIISDIPGKLFGDDFNFIWPRLRPGDNHLTINGDGRGLAHFTYRYPIKIGDCAMDISVYGGNSDCGEMAPYNTVKWENITGTPTTIAGYGITDTYTTNDVYTKEEVDDIVEDIEVSGGGNVNVDINEQELNNMLDEILK